MPALSRPASSRLRPRLAVAAALLASALVAGCGHKAVPAKSNKSAEVVATTPISYDVIDYQDFTGRLDTVHNVDLRARVAGYVTKAEFKEGDIVQEGTVLFEIDERPYKNAVESAKAQLAGAKAQLAAMQAQVGVGEANLRLAKVTYQRTRTAGAGATALELDQALAQQQVSQANLNLAKANVGNAQAAVNKAESDLQTAELNYRWTKVKAPITGRISRYYVREGNLVKADDTLLTTIVIEDPVWAYFNVDERTFLNLTGQLPGGPSDLLKDKTFRVLMRLANEDKFAHWGKIDFLDNRLNANTGTIPLRGVFDNPRGYLKPGLFVGIRLPVGKSYPALLVPDEALQSDQGRKYVFVINKDNVVEYRPVTLGQAIGGLRVIKKGLNDGERVMIAGMQRVRAKDKVQVTMKDPPPPPADPLGAPPAPLDPAKAASDQGHSSPASKPATRGGSRHGKR